MGFLPRWERGTVSPSPRLAVPEKPGSRLLPTPSPANGNQMAGCLVRAWGASRTGEMGRGPEFQNPSQSGGWGRAKGISRDLDSKPTSVVPRSGDLSSLPHFLCKMVVVEGCSLSLAFQNKGGLHASGLSGLRSPFSQPQQWPPRRGPSYSLSDVGLIPGPMSDLCGVVPIFRS